MPNSHLPYLPIDIVLDHIFPELPVKSLCRFKCLNKQICSTISDQTFKLSSRNRDRILFLSNGRKEDPPEGIIEFYAMNNKGKIEQKAPPIHHPRITLISYQPSYGRLRLLGSCNGLILMSIKHEIFLWNPSILGSCRKVLELDRLGDTLTCIRSGLCYDSDTKDYKVVLVIEDSKKFLSGSLKSKEWRQVTYPCNMESARAGPVVNNRLHWLVATTNIPMEVYRVMGGFRLVKIAADTIIYYDCSSNTFKMLPSPDPINGSDEGREEIIGVVVIDECLCMIRDISVGSKSTANCDIELLVMKEYGVKESWTSKYIIRDYCYFSTLIPLRVDLVKDTRHYDELCFMDLLNLWDFRAYNHDTKKLESMFELWQKHGYIFGAISYVENSVTTEEYYWNDERDRERKKF